MFSTATDDIQVPIRPSLVIIRVGLGDQVNGSPPRHIGSITRDIRMEELRQALVEWFKEKRKVELGGGYKIGGSVETVCQRSLI